MEANGKPRFFLMILSVILFFFTLSCTEVERSIEVPISREIPEAIRVTNVEEKFEHFEFRFFTAAGAGGLGAVVIRVGSAEKFREVVPLGEPVYVTYRVYVEYLRSRVVQSYYAFLSNRPAIVIYEKTYLPPPGFQYGIPSLDLEKDTIIFRQTDRR